MKGDERSCRRPCKASRARASVAFCAPATLRTLTGSCISQSAFVPVSPRAVHFAKAPPRRAVMVVAPDAARTDVLQMTKVFDVVVIGAGPAGLSLAAALGKRGVNTLCADPALDKTWPNNYGTWIDELEPLGLADCAANVWQKTAVYTKNNDEKSTLNRAYFRVDRKKLKARLLQRCEEVKCVKVVQGAVTDVDASHAELSTVTMEIESEVQRVDARVVVDATGHDLRFVQFEEGKDPGYQIAYGIECDVSERGYPYAYDEMMLMDFRDDHMQDTAENREASEREPTFMYVMPLDNGVGRRAFFEETSLVASPPMEMDKLKRRLYKRLKYLNVEVEKVYDVEYCKIPMGGPKPSLDQRVVAYGGAAAFVHPATGYMIARALTLADRMSESISAELNSGDNADIISRRIWSRTWNASMLRQRDFLNFGGEFLQRRALSSTREFFAAFFELPQDQWAGFLSFKLEQPLERLIFGLGIFFRTSNLVRALLIWDSLTVGGVRFFMSVLPFFMEGEG